MNEFEFLRKFLGSFWALMIIMGRLWGNPYQDPNELTEFLNYTDFYHIEGVYFE